MRAFGGAIDVIKRGVLSLATVAFGLLAAGAWNKFIADLVGQYLKNGSGVWAELLYAVVVTVLAVLVIGHLNKLAQKDIGPKI